MFNPMDSEATLSCTMSMREKAEQKIGAGAGTRHMRHRPTPVEKKNLNWYQIVLLEGHQLRIHPS
jgi:hypothetical protein